MLGFDFAANMKFSQFLLFICFCFSFYCSGAGDGWECDKARVRFLVAQFRILYIIFEKKKQHDFYKKIKSHKNEGFLVEKFHQLRAIKR